MKTLATRIGSKTRNAFAHIKGKADRAMLAAAALAGVIVASIAGNASAQYVPTSPTVDSLFDFSALGVTVLTTLGSAMAIVAGVAITIAIGIMVVRKLKNGKV